MNFLIILAIVLPVLSGAGLLFSKIEDRTEIHNFSAVILAVTAAVTVVSNFINYGKSCSMLNLPMGISLSFTIDITAAFFSTIFAVLWLLVGIYSREYFAHEPNEKRYMSFYLMAMGGIIGVAYANNPFTFYTFFEFMSLTSFVFVLNSQTKESIAAAKKYIYYSIFGALCGLISIMAFYGSDLVQTKYFVAGGSLVKELGGRMPMVALITFISIIGFCCKAGMFPLHSWLPVAHPEAPAPASAVLSGLITKTGVLAAIRIIYYVVGADVIRGTTVHMVLLILALTTIFMGSMMAYKEKLLKRRLAYSSVSQISYALFGVFMLNGVGMAGALLQIVFHALAKTTLFLTAGSVIHMTHRTKVSQLNGLGKAMPKTFALFTIAAMSLVGVPFTGGFVSKYYLVSSALNGTFRTLEFAGFVIIMISALLTGGYLLSISAKALFANSSEEICENCEVNNTMFVPVLILTALIVVLGVYTTPVMNVVTNIVSTLGI